MSHNCALQTPWNIDAGKIFIVISRISCIFSRKYILCQYKIQFGSLYFSEPKIKFESKLTISAGTNVSSTGISRTFPKNFHGNLRLCGVHSFHVCFSDFSLTQPMVFWILIKAFPQKNDSSDRTRIYVYVRVTQRNDLTFFRKHHVNKNFAF